MIEHRRRASRAVALAAAVLLTMVLVPSMASAQTDPTDPYGTTETTQPPAVQGITCLFDLNAAAVGTVVTATVTGEFTEDGDVRITFNGSTVARQAVTPTGSTQQVTLRFSVPNLPPGTYDISAVGPGFTEPCGRGTFTITGGTGGTGVNQGGGGGGSGGGSLARTGADLAPWILAGLALLGLGAFLVRQSRRRQHAA